MRVHVPAIFQQRRTRETVVGEGLDAWTDEFRNVKLLNAQACT